MLYCGLDFGTTNTKAVLLDEALTLRGSVALPVERLADSNRLDAQVWLDHFYRVLESFQTAGLIQGEKVILSIAAQGGSFVILDRHFEPISPAYLWTGTAKKETVEELAQAFGSDQFYKITGWELKGWVVPCKFREWLSEAGSEKKRVAWVMTVPDFISSQLTGRAVTDITNAQMTGMFDFNMGRWDEKILRWMGCESEWMSEVLESPRIFAEDISIRGLRVSLATSSHDQYAVMRAAGVNTVDDFMLGTGTAWVVNGKSEKPMYDDQHYSIHPGRDLTGSHYGYIATLGAIGQGFDRLLHRLNVNYESLSTMEAEAGKLSVPHEALIIDILNGLVNESDVKTKIRTNIISKSLAIRQYMEAAGAKVRFLLEKTGKKQNAKKIVMTGGATDSHLWPAIIAGICNIPVEVIRLKEMTAYGAALYARMAAGESDIKRSVADQFMSMPKDQIQRFEPIQVNEYEVWYHTVQKTIHEKVNQS